MSNKHNEYKFAVLDGKSKDVLYESADLKKLNEYAKQKGIR